ncbi:hypothetical protein RND81_03G016100 [Saponaria officinalis]|uniref:Uncharacterized protein n=1 Tax=Saponaria officinalis TaxID=3572 RepID=A0AAW1M2P0_SAPOF
MSYYNYIVIHESDCTLQVNSGKVTATMLNRFSCIALAGVATEYLLYGQAEGGLTDINKLDELLRSLGFT